MTLQQYVYTITENYILETEKHRPLHKFMEKLWGEKNNSQCKIESNRFSMELNLDDLKKLEKAILCNEFSNTELERQEYELYHKDDDLKFVAEAIRTICEDRKIVYYSCNWR